jgi:hypothetical protein
MDGHDFSLPIFVAPPERVDEQAPTKPFSKLPPLPAVQRRPLPGVDLRPPQQREVAESLLAAASADPAAQPARPSHSARHPIPSRQRARSLLGVPPPPAPRAAPLSDDDADRAARRARALQRIAWAERMLRKFQFAM